MADPADYVQVELSAHKAVAAAVAAFIAVCTSAVLLGVLHGVLLTVAEVVVGAATVLGISGSVYRTPARVLAVKVAPRPGPIPEPHTCDCPRHPPENQ